MKLVHVAHGLQFEEAALKEMNQGYQKLETGTLHNKAGIQL